MKAFVLICILFVFLVAVKMKNKQSVPVKGLSVSCVMSFRIEVKEENSIRDARTPQQGEIVFNTMEY